MNHFITRPNLSNLQFRQIEGTTLNIYGTTILDTGEIRIKENGDLILEGPIQPHQPNHSFVAADEDGVLYKTSIDLSGLTFTIYQEDHGFDVGHVVGFEEGPEIGEGKYTKAIADGTYNGEPLGLATVIINKDEFVLMQAGFADLDKSGLYENFFIPGRIYYLSDEDNGMMVLEPPTNPNSIKKPVFLPVFLDSNPNERTNLGWVLPYPPVKVSSFLQTKILQFTGDGETRDFFLPELKHDLGTKDVMIEIYRVGEPFTTVYAKIERYHEDAIKLKFTRPPYNDVNYRVLITSLF